MKKDVFLVNQGDNESRITNKLSAMLVSSLRGEKRIIESSVSHRKLILFNRNKTYFYLYAGSAPGPIKF